MPKKIIKLGAKDVVSLGENFLGLSKTFKLEDLLTHIRSILQEKSQSRNAIGICDDFGRSCQILQENGGGWQNGQFRISFEFIADVTETNSNIEDVSLSESSSVLDEIRQINS